MFSFLFHFHISQFLIVFAVWSSLWQSGKQSLFKSQPASSWKKHQISIEYNDWCKLQCTPYTRVDRRRGWDKLRWCKVDAPDLTEVEEWLKLDKGTCGDKSVCAPLLSDSRFYPHGIPKVFLSLRFGSDVKRTQAVLATVVARHKKKNMPDPILYYRNYRNGREVKKDWPDIPCLLGI